MIHVLAVGTRLQCAPVELARVAQVHTVLGVAQHVHALIRVELKRHVLVAQLGFQQMVVVLESQPHAVVACFIRRGAHFITPQGVPDATGEVIVFEVAACGVVVGLAGGPAVADVELLRGVGGRNVGASCLVIAAVKGAHFALGDGGLPRRGKFGRARLRNDGAANGITTSAHWRNACIDLEQAHLGRVDVRQRRIHVIGAGSNQVHAIHLDAQTVISQAVDRWQAGHATGAIQA